MLPTGIVTPNEEAAASASVVFTKLSLSSSKMYETLIEAPAADVDNDTPIPSSSSNPSATSESKPATSSVEPLITPATEPGVSAISMSPTTIVAPPDANVSF